jgi:hypothetical protein
MKRELRHDSIPPAQQSDPPAAVRPAGAAGYPGPDGRPPTPGWRDQVAAASTLNLIAGIWLIIAPWVLGYSGEDPRWNDVVFGAIVALFALIRISGAYRESWLSWLNALIGVWIFIAAFTIDYSTAAMSNDIIVGAIVFLLGLWSASASETAPAPRRGALHDGSRGRYRSGPPIAH